MGEVGGSCALRILFIDDNEAILNVTKEGLEELGFEVVVARTAQEALASDIRGFNVIMLDLNLQDPRGISGKTLADMVFRVTRRKPIVFSGELQPKAAPESELPYAAWIQKPAGFGLIASTLREVASRPQCKAAP